MPRELRDEGHKTGILERRQQHGMFEEVGTHARALSLSLSTLSHTQHVHSVVLSCSLSISSPALHRLFS